MGGSRQLQLLLRSWGGKRRGAGRKPNGDRAGVPHDRRPELRRTLPVHVTLRVTGAVWNLRSRRCGSVVRACIAASAKPGFQVVHYAIQGNHVHLVVEAKSTRELSGGMKGLGVRLARGLNGLIGRTGRVLTDRFHARILESPREVANALRYVLGNFASHMARLGRAVAAGFVDPYSSGSFEQLVAAGPAPPGGPGGPRPWTWLLQVGWRLGLG